MESITNPIGEILLEDGRSLLKMWQVQIASGERGFVRHSHTRFEVMTVNGGEGEYTTESAVYPVRRGDVFVFSSGEVHCITGAAGEGLSITNLHFEPRYLAVQQGNNPFIDFCFSHSAAFRNRIPAERAETPRRFFRQMEEELRLGREDFREAVCAHLGLLLIDLLRNHRYREQGGEGEQRAVFAHMLSVFSYIDEHLDEDIRLADLSALAGYSPNYFSHLFRKTNGFSLWDYITARRVDRAVKLLLSGEDQTMAEIATRCGFNSTVNFNKAFRKHKGITPSALRQNPRLLAH